MSALAVATGSINLGQGFPDADGPPEVNEAAIAAIRAGHNQYPPGDRDPRAAPARSPSTRRSGTASTYDPDTEVLVTAGATEAIAATLLALCEPGDEVVTFEPYYDSYAACIAMAGAQRRVVQLRPPDYSFDADALAARDHAAHAAPAAQLAAQPDRQGVLARRARADRATVRRARPGRGHRRGVRAPRVRRRARPARDVPGHARPHGHDLVGGQDVLVHRLEDRVGVRVARARRRGAHGEAVPHLRERRPVPARDRGRARACRDRYFRRVAADLAGEARPARRRASPPPGSTCSRRRAPTSSPPTSARWASTTGSRSAGALPERCGVVAVPSVVFYDDKDAGTPLVRFAFCKRLDVLDDAVDAAAGARTVKVAAVQHDIVWEDRDANFAQLGAADRRRRGRAGARPRRADRDVLDRVLDGDRAHRRAGRRPEHAVPRRAGRGRTACGCAGRCPRCSAGDDAAVEHVGPRRARRSRSPLRQDPPVHATAASTSTTPPATDRVTVDVDGVRCQPVRLLRPALRRRVLGARADDRLLRRRRQLARGAPRALAHAAARPGDREPGVRRRRQPRRARAASSTTRATARSSTRSAR